ncbi:MAG: TRAP transporter large permease subunit [Deltaproteobacteria bacterium]|nr:TRAP transporter large permease subunit [Deltaproteobacteria bacterium]
MDVGLVTLLLFGFMMLGLISGLSISFVLGSIGVLFTVFLWGPHALGVIPSLIFGKAMSSFGLIAIPLFILMGAILQESGMADGLFGAIHVWGGRLKGGLAVAAVLVCTLFAAMTGIGGTGTVTMGLIALPAMLSRNYDKKLALGCIAAGGALGILIPPSIIMIIYGMITQVSVGKLYAGGILPGLLLSSLYIIYILILCKMRPEFGPIHVTQEKMTLKKKIFATKSVIPALTLILAVLGSIFGGVCTPTEGAAIGAAGSLVCMALYGGLNWPAFQRASLTALRFTAMVMWIIFGAYAFATVYTALGAPDFIQRVVKAMPIGYWGVFILIQTLYFLLGMLLDPGAIVMITAPITMSIVSAMGYDETWFGVIFVMNMQMAYISPPFGYNLFYIKSISPDTPIRDIYVAIIPFIIIQAVGLTIVMLWPEIALWLPSLFFGK